MLEEQVLGTRFNPSGTAGILSSLVLLPHQRQVAGTGECSDGNRFSSRGVPKQIQNAVPLPSPRMQMNAERGT